MTTLPRLLSDFTHIIEKLILFYETKQVPLDKKRIVELQQEIKDIWQTESRLRSDEDQEDQEKEDQSI